MASISNPLVFRFFRVVFTSAALAFGAGTGTGLAVAAEPPPRLEALVLDPDGRVVAGAWLSVENPAGVVASAVSTASGVVEMTLPGPGAFTIRTGAPGLTSDPLGLRLAAGERLQVTVRLRLSALADSIVVSAGLVEASVSTAPAAATVFTDDDIWRRQAETTADLLRVSTGASVARNGGRGALTSLFPRGGESDSSLVLVDGVRVNSFGGGFDFALLPLAGVERVEIVRGPQSALFGSDAIGGVVQVITRTGGPLRMSALAEGGSLGAVRATAGAAGSRRGWTWGLSGERVSSEGFTGTFDGFARRVTNDSADHGTAVATLGWGTRTISLNSHARLLSSERGFPGPFGSDPNGTYGGVDDLSRGWNDHWTAAVRATVTPTSTWRARGFVSYAGLDGRFRSPFDTSVNESRRLDVRGQVDAALAARVGLTMGAEVLGERARSTYITGNSPDPLPVRRRVSGVFAETRVDLPRRVFAVAGLRIEHIQRHALEGNDSPFAARPAFAADAVVSINPRAAVSWLVREAVPGRLSWTRVRASAATGIRPPDAFEIAFTDNPDLEPERSRSYDLGLEQALFDGRLVADATWFHNRYDDLIVAVGRAYRDASRYQTDNIANARARGLELSASVRPGPGLGIRAGYTYLDATVLAVDGGSGAAPSPFEPGDRLIRRPRHHGWVDATFSHQRASAFLRIGARGRVLDVDPSFGAFGGKLDAPGFAVVDAGTSFTVWRSIAAFGRLSNLFDRTYEEALGFPAPGRSVVAGVRIAASR